MDMRVSQNRKYHWKYHSAVLMIRIAIFWSLYGLPLLMETAMQGSVGVYKEA